IDSCDVGHMCWNTDPDTGEGTCVRFCSGSPDAPTCDVPGPGQVEGGRSERTGSSGQVRRVSRPGPGGGGRGSGGRQRGLMTAIDTPRPVRPGEELDL
ncbi:hypothetical protein ACOXH8_46435, partial [Nannocystis pusilla]